MTLKNEKRAEQILLSLKKLDYLSRSQIQRLHNLGTDRNARRVLADMSDYLNSFRHEENVYYLSKAGRDLVKCGKERKKTVQIDHFLLRNELYIFLGRPSTWRNEMRIKQNGKSLLVADATFTRDSTYHFVEVDCTQKMIKNASKIRRYKSLKGEFKLIWITTTEFRRKRLAELCEGLDAVIYTINDI